VQGNPKHEKAFSPAGGAARQAAGRGA
jgi:hypothetical protein